MKRLGRAIGLLTLGAALALGGCGRRGALDAPNASPVAGDPAVAQPYDQPAGVGASSSVARPAPAQTDRFPLDFLI